MIIKTELSEKETHVDWDMGTDMACELLNDINLVSKRPSPFRVDSRDYKIYWTGNILRIDIPKEAVS